MALNHFTCGIFDPVDVVGNESIAQPRNPQDTNTGAHTRFEGAGVEDVVGVHFAKNGGQGCNTQHDDQDCVGGVHQRLLNQSHTRAVDNCIDNHANYAQQEQPDGCFRALFDFNLLLTAQLNQAFFQTLAINRIVRQFGVEQHGYQEGHHQNRQQSGWDDHRKQMEIADAMTFHHGRHVNDCCRDWRCGDRNLCGNYRCR